MPGMACRGNLVHDTNHCWCFILRAFFLSLFLFLSHSFAFSLCMCLIAVKTKRNVCTKYSTRWRQKSSPKLHIPNERWNDKCAPVLTKAKRIGQTRQNEGTTRGERTWDERREKNEPNNERICRKNTVRENTHTKISKRSVHTVQLAGCMQRKCKIQQTTQMVKRWNNNRSVEE